MFRPSTSRLATSSLCIESFTRQYCNIAHLPLQAKTRRNALVTLLAKSTYKKPVIGGNFFYTKSAHRGYYYLKTGNFQVLQKIGAL